MKRVLSVLVALLLCLTMVSAAMAELSFTTGGTAGTYYAYGGVLAQYVSDHSDVKVVAVAGEGSAANVEYLDMGLNQLGFCQSDVAYYAYNGIRFEQFEGNPITSFRALAALYLEQVQLVTSDPNVKSMADLKGKSVSIGAVGSGVYFNAMDFLAVYGMTEADIEPQYLSFADSAEALKDGKIEAFFCVAGAPTTAIVDLCATKGAYLVSVDEEHLAKLKELNAAYTESVIAAGTYEGIETDTVTVGVKSVVLASADVTDEEAYAIVSTIFENADEIAQAHAKGKDLDLAFAAECGVPYHAGAARYFAEKGITVQTAD